MSCEVYTFHISQSLTTITWYETSKDTIWYEQLFKTSWITSSFMTSQSYYSSKLPSDTKPHGCIWHCIQTLHHSCHASIDEIFKYHKISNTRHTKSQNLILLSSCSCLCPIHWSQVLSREWRCSWSSANRRCSNYIWVINNFIAY